MKVIGLMSGTSADGVNAALVEWPDQAKPTPFKLLCFEETVLPAALQRRVHRLAAAELPANDILGEQLQLDVALADVFADAATRCAKVAGITLAEVAAIASHGQTIVHHPEYHASLQLGDPSRIAENTGCCVVADFRARDLAAGGEGAPLVPFFHHAAFAGPNEDRVVLNLGGIANITWLPSGASGDVVKAFDVGPANVLSDAIVQLNSNGAERFDREGACASQGSVNGDLLRRLLQDDYLQRPPPKSTGRERYGLALARTLLDEARQNQIALEDLLATLIQFSASAIAQAVGQFLPRPPTRVLCAGGGIHNQALWNALCNLLAPIQVETSDAHGVPPLAVEAMAFSLMGRNALLALPNHLPQCTGAKGARVLGEVIPAA